MCLKRFSLVLALALSFGVSNGAISKPAVALPIAPDAQNVNIIYIHGAHETRGAFDKSVRNVHDDMVKELQNDPLIYEKVLKNGKKKIGEKEIIFFWADKAEENVKIVDKALSYAKDAGSKLAQFGRATLSHTLHDAIWVSKPVNSKPILNNLNETVKAEYKKGNHVILYGYSAGSLIAYQYMTRKIRMIDLNELNSDKSHMGKYFARVVKNNNIEATCLDALTESKILFYTDNDEFVTNPNVGYLKTTFPKLNYYTDEYCAPSGSVEGVVAFGTPLTTFNSSGSQVGTSANLLTQYLMKYLVENDLFLLTVNYAQDFIGMPMPAKPNLVTFKESPLLKDIKPMGGFIYDESGVKCPASIVSAHLAYWTNGKRFARTIVKAYNDGYKFFYDN